MILSGLATVVLAVLAMAPGPLLCRGARLDTALLAALAAASLAVSMMATALIGAGLHALAGASLPAWAFGPVSFILCLLAVWRSRGAGWRMPALEWPALALAAVFFAYGAVTYAIAVTDLADGSLRVHAWYNADWFKHLGHVYALADYGIPARDIYAGGRPLNYYWLTYVLPGAGAAIGGDGWAALHVSNFVMATLLWLTFYGLIRALGVPAVIAALAVLFATLLTAPFQTWFALFQQGTEALLYGPEVPVGSSFLSFQLYIPQHAFAVALLLGWATTVVDPRSGAKEARLVALAGLATLMTVSTLFGAALLGTYGLFELCRRRLAAVPELAVLAAVAGLLVLLLGVIDLGHANSAMQSPALANAPRQGTTLARAFLSLMVVLRSGGLAFPLCLFLAYKWHPRSEPERLGRAFAILLAIVALSAGLALEFVFEPRIAQEIRMRVLNLPTVTVGIVGGWYVWQAWSADRRSRITASLWLAVLTTLALPSIFLQTAWHGNRSDMYTTVVPADDRAVLADLKRESAPRDAVWQYPEKPFLSDLKGRDVWSVAFAGRTVLASERATDYPAAYPDIERAYRYFAGDEVAIPAQAGWVYLSRVLHPVSYDRLRERLLHDPQWRPHACLQNACLFSRVTRPAST